MKWRIGTDILLLISILTLPFWCSVIIGLAGVCFFESFFEIIIAGLLVDILYMHSIGFLHVPYAVFLASVLAYAVAEYIKKALLR